MEDILEDVRRLIRENILPRLTEVEISLDSLRRETWPVSQFVMEKYMLDDFDKIRYNRRRFLRSIDDNEAEFLLRRLKNFRVM